MKQYKDRDITHCPQGHEYTEENTIIRPRKNCRDARVCRKCYQVQNRSGNKRQREKMKAWYYSHLLTLSCVECGESRTPALQFNHRDPSQKSFTISSVIGSGYSKKRILEEMDKCDVLCANCHAVHTAQQQGWYKYGQKNE